MDTQRIVSASNRETFFITQILGENVVNSIFPLPLPKGQPLIESGIPNLVFSISRGFNKK